MNVLSKACEFLAISDQPTACDLIFVLAGRDDRKPYGLQLFQQHLAPRLILSVGRFEVRNTATLIKRPELVQLRDETPREKRHFWIDFKEDEVRICHANLKETNTFWELDALAKYLQSAAISSVAVISTSIHLRRVRFCCNRIAFFRERTVRFVPVPEPQSSFQQHAWWKHPDHWWYVLSEYVKLAAYRLRYRHLPGDRVSRQ